MTRLGLHWGYVQSLWLFLEDSEDQSWHVNYRRVLLIWDKFTRQDLSVWHSSIHVRSHTSESWVLVDACACLLALLRFLFEANTVLLISSDEPDNEIMPRVLLHSKLLTVTDTMIHCTIPHPVDASAASFWQRAWRRPALVHAATVAARPRRHSVQKRERKTAWTHCIKIGWKSEEWTTALWQGKVPWKNWVFLWTGGCPRFCTVRQGDVLNRIAGTWHHKLRFFLFHDQSLLRHTLIMPRFLDGYLVHCHNHGTPYILS